MQRRRRRLLVASVGVASVSYVLSACGKDRHPVSGNLPAPPATEASTVTGKPPVTPPTETWPITGNLPAPSPVDASDELPPPSDAPPGSW